MHLPAAGFEIFAGSRTEDDGIVRRHRLPRRPGRQIRNILIADSGIRAMFEHDHLQRGRGNQHRLRSDRLVFQMKGDRRAKRADAAGRQRDPRGRAHRLRRQREQRGEADRDAGVGVESGIEWNRARKRQPLAKARRHRDRTSDHQRLTDRRLSVDTPPVEEGIRRRKGAQQHGGALGVRGGAGRAAIDARAGAIVVCQAILHAAAAVALENDGQEKGLTDPEAGLNGQGGIRNNANRRGLANRAGQRVLRRGQRPAAGTTFSDASALFSNCSVQSGSVAAVVPEQAMPLPFASAASTPPSPAVTAQPAETKNATRRWR